MKARQRILVVDDDFDNALVVKMIMECNDFQVDMFTDAQLALSKFEPQRYSLAVIDLRLGDLSGFELYERMNKMDNKMKVCFMSGYNYGEEELSEFQDRHCEVTPEHYLRKPLSVGGFMATVKKMAAESPATLDAKSR